jgi:16S rRNA (uracil1498-N3)-methyltransferase
LDRRDVPPLRSLPRVFLPGLDTTEESFDLPKEEVEKFRKVLRLAEGDQIAVLPNDGTLIRCELRARRAWPISTETPRTEPTKRVTIAQAFPKGDRLETVLRMGTELGVAAFELFQAERSVVRWDAEKLEGKRRRYEAIVREAAEQSFRSKLPEIAFCRDLGELLRRHPTAVVLSEVEGLTAHLPAHQDEVTLVVGPEGGWAPREIELIGDRGVTLGPLVLRTDTAGPAAAATLLLESRK